MLQQNEIYEFLKRCYEEFPIPEAGVGERHSLTINPELKRVELVLFVRGLWHSFFMISGDLEEISSETFKEMRADIELFEREGKIIVRSVPEKE